MIYEFDRYQLDTAQMELRGPTGPIGLEPKCLALLTLLVEERARAVAKDEIFEMIWPGLHVTEASLSTAIRQIRRAVDDTGERQSVIKTVRGHGFRFVAEVRQTGGTTPIPAGLAATKDTGPIVRSGKPTIAIRPFRLLGEAPAHQAIAEAIPAELIATLSRLRWLNVIARGSSFRFDPTASDISGMGGELGAQFIVSGVVEWLGSAIAISAELTDARSGQVIWAERINGSIDDVYDLRARIARELVIALELRLPMHEADRLTHVPSESLDAWGHYHLGIRHMYRYNPKDNSIAATCFRQAILLDPTFARAFAGLSYTEFQNAFQHYKSEIAHHRHLALAHAEEAMRLDPLDPFCNLIFGRAKWLLGDPEDGITWIDRSIELNPNYAFGYYNNATLNTVLCNGSLADENAGTALMLSPLDPNLQSFYGTRALAALVAGEPDAAARYADRAVNAPNPHLYVYMIAAVVYSQTGDPAKAQKAVEGVRAKEVQFGKSEFLTYFNLRAPDHLGKLEKTLNELGV